MPQGEFIPSLAISASKLFTLPTALSTVTFAGCSKFEDYSDNQKVIIKLDQLTDELKALYKELRKSGENSHERGGGLGFLEIQRKSTMPLKYRFEKIDEKYQFFSLKSLI
jgi:hypothetical protein